MIKCKVLNKEFETKRAMFSALKENKEKIISLKKSQVYNSCEKGGQVPLSLNGIATKGIDGLEKGFIYPVISNTYYMDDHLDVHIKNSMNRTVEQQQGKVHYVVNHELKIGKIIAYPKDVEMFLKEVSWRELGKDYDGKTQALLFKTNIYSYSNKDAADAVREKAPVQGSIRMLYFDMSMAIDSDDPDLKEENAEFQKHIDKIANKEKAKEVGYFFPVYELGITQEGSMVVQGSNDATEIQYNSDSSKQGTHESDAAKQATREADKKQYFINQITNK